MVVQKVAGNTVYVSVPIQNTGDARGTAYVRVSLVLPPAVTGIDLINDVSGAKDGVVTLNPGEQKTLFFSAVIPIDSPLGLYSTVGISRTGPGLTGDVLDQKVEAGQVNITGLDGDVVLTDDAYVNYKYPDNNYGGSSVLNVDFSGYWDIYRDIYLKFSIPNITINSAQLVIRVNEVKSGEGGTIVAVDSEDGWTEGTLTWNNRPTLRTIELFAEKQVPVGTGYDVTFDVTNFVKAHRGENITIAIIGITEEVSAKISSKEGSYPPEIQIS